MLQGGNVSAAENREYRIDGFRFFTSFYESLKDLEPEDVKLLLMAMCEYAFYGKEPDNLSGLRLSFFKSIRPIIDASIRRTLASRENGGLGGRPPINPEEPKRTYEEPKEAYKKPDKDKDKDSFSYSHSQSDSYSNSSPLSNSNSIDPDPIPANDDVYEVWKRKKGTLTMESVRKLNEMVAEYGQEDVINVICHIAKRDHTEGDINGYLNESLVKKYLKTWKTHYANPNRKENI